MKTRCRQSLLAITMLGVFYNNGYAAQGSCVSIGGTLLGDKEDESNRIVAATGDFTGAHVKVLDKKPTKTGLALSTEHYFVNGRGGLLKTQDTLTLTKVIDNDMSYMVEGTYSVIESKGTFTEYKGSFNSFGLMKLDQGKSILHYSGTLCK